MDLEINLISASIEKPTESESDLIDVPDNDLTLGTETETNLESDDILNHADINYFEDSERLNESKLSDSAKTLDTIAHEYRHAYQHKHAINPTSERDIQFHNFYAGYNSKGIIQLILGLIGVGAFFSGIWAIIDIITVNLDGFRRPMTS